MALECHLATTAAPGLLEIRNLSVVYDRFPALKDLNMTLQKGEIVSIIGANGAGKTSLMKAIVGQAKRDGGSICFKGRELMGIPTKSIVASGIALVPEGRRLFAGLTVEENLKIGLHLRGRPGMVIEQIYEAFPVLKEKRKFSANLLSGGQQQMVAIGRALLTNPELLLCDEISLGLAPIVVQQLYEFLTTLKMRGISIMVVEQDIRRSLAVADRFYCLLEGKIVLDGKPGDFDRATIIDSYFGTKAAP